MDAINLIKVINNAFNCNIKNTSRKRELVENRIIYAKIMHNTNIFTLSKIASYIDKDHATIIHYLKQHDDFFKYDDFYKSKFKKIQSLINDYKANYIKELNKCEFKVLRYETK